MDRVADLRRRNIVPFLGVAVVSFATLLLPPYAPLRTSDLTQQLAAAVAAAVTALLAALTVRLAPTHPLVAVPPLAFLGVAGLAEYAAGGEVWGLTPVVILPVLWFVLYGTRLQLGLSVAGVAAFFVVPLLVVGPPMYPSSGWRRALAWTLIVAVVCPILQRAVEALRRTADLQRRSSERWRSLLDLLPDTTVAVVDDRMRYRLATGAEVTKRGSPVEGLSVDETSTPETAAVLKPLFHQALAGHPAGTDVVGRSGARLRVEVVPLRAAGATEGPAQEALVVSHDVTEARHREQELHAAVTRASRLLQESPHGLFIVSSDGVLTDVNPALCALLGREARDLLGTRLDSAPLGLDEVVDRLSELLGDERTQRLVVDTVVSPADRDPVDVSLTAAGLDLETDGRPSLIVTLVDISERRRYEQRLTELAEQDPLTGLANRRTFDAALRTQLERARRSGTGGALLLLDLDDFKQVNDTLGHGVGDRVIRAVAGLLAERMRAVDLVARLGGDEFAILLVDEDRGGAEVVARDVVALVRDEVRVVHDGRRRRVTASVGVVMLDDGMLSPEQAVSTADMVMYDAKEAGRNQYLVHDTSLHALPRTGARIAWLERIAAALHEDRFVVRAQPVVDVTTGRVVGAELLIRMLDEDGELVPPSHFLYIAERSELIRDIDMLMTGHAVRLLARLQAVDPDFFVEVNLSGHSVGSERVGDHISRLVRDGGVDPHGLVFEVTETAAVSDLGQARAFAERLHALGCRFALDDFGAGFGSFYYLKHLVFDYIKIDGDFVRTCGVNPTDRLIVSSVVGIARGLGKRTVAEYVESEEVLEAVRSLGVDLAQGFLVGRPDTEEVLLDVVRRQALTPRAPE